MFEHRPSFWVFIVAIVFYAETVAHADLLLIANPSFESTFLSPGTFATVSAPPGWSAYGDINLSNRAIGSLNPNSTTLYTQPVPDGSNVGVVFLLDNFSNQSQFINSEGGLQQTLSSQLQSSTQYSLSVHVGNIGNDANFPHSQFQFGGFPGYRIDLLAGSTVIASESSLTSSIPADGAFKLSTISYISGSNDSLAGAALGIRLVNLNNAPGIEVNFDNVRLEATAVPEPSSLTTIGVLGVALAYWRKRMKKCSIA